MIGFRFHYRPGSFITTFTDQVESLFIPAVVSAISDLGRTRLESQLITLPGRLVRLPFSFLTASTAAN